MNIEAATRQVEGAVRAYLARDERGLWLIPQAMQRPIILMGPPGIGKTAIVGQIAERLGVNFVSYSITHHTRQSALGLPYIADATFGGRPYKVSRYTMSEIIAAAYDSMEASGIPEGILFLDEVNCASETLMPSMLQFLQYKTFGQHRLPEGWVIVCAGNPTEYNRAARDFDPAMMDRMKRIDIEPDVDVWMDYATSHGVHPAVTSYLASRPQHFYRVRAGVRGARLVTARGWEDLSRMLVAYRQEGIAWDRDLVSQYLQDEEVSEDFSLYLELFAKYEDDYKVADVLAGTSGPDIASRAQAAPLDERIALVSLLQDSVTGEVHEAASHERALGWAREALLAPGADVEGELAGAREALAEARAKGGLSEGRLHELAERASLAERARDEAVRARGAGSNEAEAVAVALDGAAEALSAACAAASDHLDHALSFLDGCFGDGQEMLVFVSHLAVDPMAMAFAAAHGSGELARHGRSLMLQERGLDLLRRVDALAGDGGANG